MYKLGFRVLCVKVCREVPSVSRILLVVIKKPNCRFFYLYDKEVLDSFISIIFIVKEHSLFINVLHIILFSSVIVFPKVDSYWTLAHRISPGFSSS